MLPDKGQDSTIVPMGKSDRSQRHEQFRSSGEGVYSPLSGDLLEGALVLLQAALHDRKSNLRLPDNHYTQHAVGSIALAVNGLEAWLNESIWWLSALGHDKVPPYTSETLRKIANGPLKAKYYEIPKRVTNTTIPEQSDFELLNVLRDEIVHFVPRVIEKRRPTPEWTPHHSPSGEINGWSRVASLEDIVHGARRYVPPTLRPLFERQLFFVPLSNGSPETNYPLAQQLGSYKLVCWAWETISAAVFVFLGALGDEAEGIAHMAGNFERFRTLPGPEQLAEYDAAHGLGSS